MLFARFEYRGTVFYGAVKERKIVVLDGSPFDAYEESGT
jgi:hypothetical protein